MSSASGLWIWQDSKASLFYLNAIDVLNPERLVQLLIIRKNGLCHSNLIIGGGGAEESQPQK